ncbi:MAG: hypothetical protein ACXIUD_09675 [Mongoliitalea sp.]
MKIKLNKSQLEALRVLLTKMIHLHTPKDMAENLLDTLVRQVLEKVTIKLAKSLSEHKVKHTLSLSHSEAMGLHLWFHQLVTEEIWSDYQYEAIVCRNIVAEIDREYA